MKREKQQIQNELLVIRCQQGDKSAFEELVQLWEKKLLYYIRRLVSDEDQAWTIMSDTWLKVLRGIKSVKKPDRFAPWLYTIARNTAMSTFRKQYAWDAISEPADVAMVGEDETDQNETAEEVHFALQQLELPLREVLTLHYLQDLSIVEIAAVLEIPAGTVKSRLFQARQSLKAVLQRERRRHA